MSEPRRSFRIDGDKIVFTTLKDVSGMTREDIALEMPNPFGQPNERGSLRPVETLNEISDLARHAAKATKELFRMEDD